MKTKTIDPVGLAGIPSKGEDAYTIADLIRELSTFDPNTRVLVDSYESGYDAVTSIRKVAVVAATDREGSWEGRYRDMEVDDHKSRVFVALVVPRVSKPFG